LTLDEIRRSGQEGFLWGIVIDDLGGAQADKYGELIREIAEHPERFQDFERVQLSSPALILRYVEQNGLTRVQQSWNSG
jgi:hypothetical protein